MEVVLQQGKRSISRAKTQGRNLTECAYKNVPKSVGVKAGDWAERKRIRKPQTKRSTGGAFKVK